MNAYLAPLPTHSFLACHLAGRDVGVSPLQLADQILSLAQAADRAGYPGAAANLLTAMYAVLDRPH